jgi:hypothetical protein
MAGGVRSNADSLLIAALAAGATNEDAAAQAGVSVRTLQRRLAEPGFKQKVDQARSDLIFRAVGALADASSEAAQTLRDLLASDRPSVQLGAAKAILDLGIKVREHAELADRIEALEAAQGMHQ